MRELRHRELVTGQIQPGLPLQRELGRRDFSIILGAAWPVGQDQSVLNGALGGPCRAGIRGGKAGGRVTG